MVRNIERKVFWGRKKKC